MSIAEHIDIMALIGSDTTLKRVSGTRGGEYAGACPLSNCGGVDRFRVWPQISMWSCRECVGSNVPTQDAIEYVKRRNGVNFVDACKTLGIKLPNGRKPVSDSEITYDNLAAYAAMKGVPETVFSDVGWYLGERYNRPGFIYPTYAAGNGEVQRIDRIRFTDGKDPKYMPCDKGTPNVWYGLKSAIELATNIASPIFLCNGEASERVAAYWGVPAFCKTGGENIIPQNLLDELELAWSSEVVIALDCDMQGREVSEKIKAQQLQDAHIIDLGLDNKGDLADYCKLYETDSLEALLALVPRKLPTTVKEASAYVVEIAYGNIIAPGRTLTFPFQIYHSLGGICRYMPPGKLTLIHAMSSHGKTSYVETMYEFWQQQGNSGIFDGREFAPDEYEFRRIQRYSGQTYTGFDDTSVYVERLSYTEFLGHKKCLEEERDETPSYLRDGKRITPAQLKSVLWVDNYVQSWRGKLKHTPRFAYLEDLLDWSRSYIGSERDAGRYVDFMIFDYIQLYKIRGNDTAFNALQAALYMIKDFLGEMAIHGIVLSQVNKTADNNQRNLSKPLTVADMNYINDAPANLTISLNLNYRESDETDYQGNPVMEMAELATGMYAGMAWVLKNTMARKGQILQQADFKHYRWLDVAWEWKSFDLLREDVVQKNGAIPT